MEIIRARVEQQKNIYIHNDLLHTAEFFRRIIDDKVRNNDRDALLFYGMACALMLAFTFEAKINFLGHKLVPDWRERRRSIRVKADEVLAHLGVQADWETRPYSSIAGLIEFRNSVAHGKPVEIVHDETVEVPADELDRRVDLSGEWEAACTPEKITQATGDLDDIWQDLLKRSRLTKWQTMTTGEHAITFIEKITVADPSGDQ